MEYLAWGFFLIGIAAIIWAWRSTATAWQVSRAMKKGKWEVLGLTK